MDIHKMVDDMPLMEMKQANLKILSRSEQSTRPKAHREFSRDKSPLKPNLVLLRKNQLMNDPEIEPQNFTLTHAPSGSLNRLTSYGSLRNSLKTRKEIPHAAASIFLITISLICLTILELSDANIVTIEGMKVKKSRYMIAVINDEKEREYVTGVTLEYMIMRITKEISGIS
jgi:hypothetical protein